LKAQSSTATVNTRGLFRVRFNEEKQQT
jgi:hypothetical protein